MRGAKLLHRLGRKPLHLGGIGDIGAHAEGLRSRAARLRDRLVERILLHVREHQLHPLACADARELPAEATARPGDDGDPARKILHR